MQATGTSHIGSESTNNSIDDDDHDAEDLGATLIPPTNRAGTMYLCDGAACLFL